MVVKVNARGADGNIADTILGDYEKTDSGIMMPHLMEISGPMGMQPIEFTNKQVMNLLMMKSLPSREEDN